MDNRFDIRELVKVAIADEQSGIELYEKLSHKAQDSRLKDTFSRLSSVEKIHRDRFEKLAESLNTETSAGLYPDEYVDYLQILVQEGGGAKAHNQIEKKENDRDLLELAIKFEREQLSLQQEFTDLLEEKYKDIVNEIIREERNHIVQLSQVEKELFT